MHPRLKEFLVVLETSAKTQVALAMTVVLPLAILVLGNSMARGITFADPLAALAGPVREMVLHRYAEAALLALLGSASLVVKSFRRARERLFR